MSGAVCPRCRHAVIGVRSVPFLQGIETVRPHGGSCCSEFEGDLITKADVHKTLSRVAQQIGVDTLPPNTAWGAMTAHVPAGGAR